MPPRKVLPNLLLPGYVSLFTKSCSRHEAPTILGIEDHSVSGDWLIRRVGQELQRRSTSRLY